MSSQPSLFHPDTILTHKPFGKSTRRKSMPRAPKPGPITIDPAAPAPIQLRQIEAALANVYWSATKHQQKQIGELLYTAREFVRQAGDTLNL